MKAVIISHLNVIHTLCGRIRFGWMILVPCWTIVTFAGTLNRNETVFSNSPVWLTVSQVDRVIANIQKYMEWDIRKVKVIWYDDQIAFQKFHGYDATVFAISKKPENCIYLGPRVVSSNFDAIFGHELVHIILYQKFKDAIPNWLEEGLANYIAKKGKVDYLWLAMQPSHDVRLLAHPFLNAGVVAVSSTYHYQASTAVVEMIASRCNLSDLLQLSVGKKLENYLSTFCEISDLNADFKKWIKNKNFSK